MRDRDGFGSRELPGTSLASFASMDKTGKREEAWKNFEKALENTGQGSGLTGGPTRGEPGHDGDEDDPGGLGDTDYTPVIGNVFPRKPRQP